MKKDGNTKQLTVLVDIDELKEFQSACRTQDMNSSQVIRMFIRDYIKKYGTTKEGKNYFVEHSMQAGMERLNQFELVEPAVGKSAMGDLAVVERDSCDRT